jgi:hypothetical protein
MTLSVQAPKVTLPSPERKCDGHSSVLGTCKGVASIPNVDLGSGNGGGLAEQEHDLIAGPNGIYCMFPLCLSSLKS